MQNARSARSATRSSSSSFSYELFSDFEDTLVVPEISYKEWVLPRVADRERFEAEYENRREKAREERSTRAWENYLNLYARLLSAQDFKEMSARYSMNRVFSSWCKRFFRAHGYTNAKLTVLTRGFAPIARNYVERSDVKSALAQIGISAATVIGCEPSMDNKGMMKEGLKSVIYSKRKFVKDGHVMLGDDGDEWDFRSYPYFVNLSKWRSSSNE